MVQEVDGKKTLNITKWMGTKKQLSALQTFKSHVQNMIIGVRPLGSAANAPDWGGR